MSLGSPGNNPSIRFEGIPSDNFISNNFVPNTGSHKSIYTSAGPSNIPNIITKKVVRFTGRILDLHASDINDGNYL